jgi:hypothetical protein
LPLLAPAVWLLALFIRAHALVWPRQLRRAVTWTVAVITIAMLIYSLGFIPLLQHHEKVRPIARQLEKSIPPDETLYAIDPDYQPYLFYLRRPIDYASDVRDLPRSARFILVQPKDEKAVEQSQLWSPQQATPILRIKDYRGRRVILLRVESMTGH